MVKSHLSICAKTQKPCDTALKSGCLLELSLQDIAIKSGASCIQQCIGYFVRKIKPKNAFHCGKNKKRIYRVSKSLGHISSPHFC